MGSNLSCMFVDNVLTKRTFSNEFVDIHKRQNMIIVIVMVNTINEKWDKMKVVLFNERKTVKYLSTRVQNSITMLESSGFFSWSYYYHYSRFFRSL